MAGSGVWRAASLCTLSACGIARWIRGAAMRCAGSATGRAPGRLSWVQTEGRQATMGGQGQV
jgi:hypothetical protein